jgi:hypothetical protein
VRRRPSDSLLRYHLVVVVLCLTTLGCGVFNTRELTRARALSTLREHGSFKKPDALPLSGAEKFPVPAESAGEPVPVERAVELFFDDRPGMGVLRHLGMVEVSAEAVERPQVLPFTGGLTMWKFRIVTRLTAEGEEASRDAGLKGGSVPVFRREVMEVTGVTKESESTASVDFTWKAVPTPVGEAFDPSSATFRALPPKLQQKITRVTIFGDSLKLSFGETRRATARLRLYDDGWRVESVQV